jgi:hypothetical protein
MSDIEKHLTEAFAAVLADRNIRGNADNAAAMVKVVTDMLASLATVHVAGARLGTQEYVSNGGDVTVRADASGDVTQIDVIEGAHIVELEFWL